LVIFGLGDLSMLQCCVLCSVFYLLAGMPMRRPYTDFVTALSAGPWPSGFVPGGGVGSRDVEFFVFVGGEEPDCVLKNNYSVLFVKVEGLIVISFFCGPPCKMYAHCLMQVCTFRVLPLFKKYMFN
jgi:hypothetical protein